MPHIRLEKVAFGYTDTLFRNVTLTINDNDRIGIVGNNGSGKSTLLKCIAGLLPLQEGHIYHPKGLKFGFIEQDIPKNLYEQNLYEVLSDAIPLMKERIRYGEWTLPSTTLRRQKRYVKNLLKN